MNYLKSQYLLKSLMLIGIGCCSTQGLAAPAQPATGIQPNCDFRILALNDQQKQQWKRIRMEYRVAYENVHSSRQQMNQIRRQKIFEILSAPSFNDNNARRYVQEIYNPVVDLAVLDLSVQYRMFHVLTPRQQVVWLSNCVR